MTIAPKPRLLQPVTIGLGSNQETSIHRIAMAPLTRMRNNTNTQIPTDMAVEYYGQRASKGGLLITEATFISKEAGGYSKAPGIYSEEQVASWKKVTDAVHAKGGIIFMQFWALGRANGGEMSDVEIVAPSAIPLHAETPEKTLVPRALTEEDIERYIASYKTAAENAKRAGFDGVELHGANGYLVDQFLQTVSNERTDSYGGSVENRSRFAFRALEQITSVFGPERTGIRISPWGRFQDMLEEDPLETTFAPFVAAIVKKYPNFGYIHLTEARNWSADLTGVEDTKMPKAGLLESNDYLRAIIRGVDTSKFESIDAYNRTEPKTEDPSKESPIVILSAAGHNAGNVYEHVERTGDVAAIGRYFIANPDLPHRIFNKLPVNHYDRHTFYTDGPRGYTDLPTYEEDKKAGRV